jgi:predicted permease
MFSIVHGGTRDLPFPRSHQLVVVSPTNPREGWDLRAGHFDYLEWSRQQRAFQALAAFREGSVNLGGEGRRPERRNGARLTANGYGLLSATPLLGRVLSAGDAIPGAPAVVLLSYDLWQSRFDRDSSIVGRTLRVDGVPSTIVGVMREGFRFPVNSDVWLPLALDPSAAPGVDGQLTMFGRLREGVTVDQARVEAATIATRLAREYRDTHGERSARVYPFVELEMEPEVKNVLYLMLGAVSFVLLIACANVANLLLARAAGRTRDVAIRTALGATRGRLIAQHLTESTLLAVVGGLLGLGMAHAAVRFFARSTAHIIEAFWMEFRVDGTVVGFAALLMMAAGLVAGLLPALRASVPDVSEVLKDAGGGTTGLRIGRAARTLVMAEMALATGLLIVTLTFVRSALELRAVALPFPARQVFTAELDLDDYLDDPGVRERFVRDLSDRVRAIPGVRAGALATALPGRGAGQWTFSLDAPAARGGRDGPTTGLAVVTPEYFDVLDARVLRGRGLTWRDDDTAPPVVVVNETFVRKYSPDREPLGRRVFVGARGMEIVGVVPDLQIQDVDDPAAEGVYAPMLQMRPYGVRIMARAAGDPLAITPAVWSAMAAVDPDLPIFDIMTLRDAIYSEKRVLEVFSVLFLIFGLGALFLAVLGLYGVVSFAVSRRTREIGVRVALGATPRQVAGLVLRQGATLVGMGTAVGLFIAFGLSQALAAGIEDLEPAGVPTYLAIVGTLSATALVGLLWPARRALRLEPATALRAD